MLCHVPMFSFYFPFIDIISWFEYPWVWCIHKCRCDIIFNASLRHLVYWAYRVCLLKGMIYNVSLNQWFPDSFEFLDSSSEFGVCISKDILCIGLFRLLWIDVGYEIPNLILLCLYIFSKIPLFEVTLLFCWGSSFVALVFWYKFGVRVDFLMAALHLDLLACFYAIPWGKEKSKMISANFPKNATQQALKKKKQYSMQWPGSSNVKFIAYSQINFVKSPSILPRYSDLKWQCLLSSYFGIEQFDL